jgi:hypothetical protein
MSSMKQHDDGSVTLDANEVAELREVLHWLQAMTRSFAGEQGNDIYNKLIHLRRELGSDFYTP